MDEIAGKTCAGCGKTKPLVDFPGVPGKWAKLGDGKQKNCADCKSAQKAARFLPIERAKSESTIAEDDGPVLQQAHTLGFKAQMQGGDIVIEQVNGGELQQVWLSRHEIDDLYAWVNGLRQSPFSAGATHDED